MAFPTNSQSQYLLNQVALSNAIRRLWVDNNQWTRALIQSVLYEQGNQDELLDRIRENADDFSTLFGQFYGEDAGRQVEKYINNDLDGTLRLITAYKADDAQAIRSAREYLYANMSDFSRYLARINRYLDMATLEVMLYELINLAEYEIILIRDREFAKSIDQHDELMNQGYKLADELSYGILKQFQV